MPYYNDYLMHYGVLGMKWGVRRARKNQEKAASARKAGNTAAAKKYEAKAKKIESKHVARTDRRTYDYVKKQSALKLAGESMIMGTYGALKYNEARSAGASTGKSLIKGIVSGTLNNMTFGGLGAVQPRLRARKAR